MVKLNRWKEASLSTDIWIKLLLIGLSNAVIAIFFLSGVNLFILLSFKPCNV